MSIRAPDEINCLKQMRNLISKDFTIDHIGIIEMGLQYSNLNSTLVYRWLCQAREKSISITTLDAQIKKIKEDYVSHLDERISLLEQLRELKPAAKQTHRVGQDPWSFSVKLQGEMKEKFVRVSLHLREILFACREIIQTIPSEAERLDKTELQDFITVVLPTYLALLPKNPLRPESFDQNLTDLFKELENKIQLKQFDSAEPILKKIHAVLADAAA